MAYLHDCGCDGGTGRCACARSSGGRAEQRCGSGSGFGERYLPQVFDGDGSLGIALLKKAVTFAGRVMAKRAAVKGQMAERLMAQMPQYKAAIGEAKARALKEGIDPRTVKVTKNVRGIHHDGAARQLTDGVIYGRTKSGKVRIFNVFESKARRSLKDLAFREGKLKDLGQVARDFERLKELPLKIDGQVLQPEQVLVSRGQTAWTLFGPKGTKLHPQDAAEISQASGFNMRHVELPYTNAQLSDRAAKFVKRYPPK